MNGLQTVTINSTDISVKEYKGKRVVTLKEIDQCHGRPDGTARRNFNQNKQHLIEGVDYFIINQPNEIRTLGITRPQELLYMACPWRYSYSYIAPNV